MNKPPIYLTDNYHLACYLLGRGAVFLGVEKDDSAPAIPLEDVKEFTEGKTANELPEIRVAPKIKLYFRFEIPVSMNLAKILVWWSSKDAADIKRMLAATKTIKLAIHEYLLQQ